MSQLAQVELPLLSDLLKRIRLHVFTEFLPFPPRTSLPVFINGGETITIKTCPNVPWWLTRKWVVRQQSAYVLGSLQKPDNEPSKPGIFFRRCQRGEPHLPVEPRLVRCTPAGGAHYVPRLPFELVREPINPIGAAFEHNLSPVLCHYAEESVAVHYPKRFETTVNRGERARPACVRPERSEDKPRVDRQCNNDRSDRSVAVVATALCRRGWNVMPEGALMQRGERRIINQQQTQRDRQQIEKAIIASNGNHDL